MNSGDPALLATGALSARQVGESTKEAFLEAYGHLFEHSPWVVERAWDRRPFKNAFELHSALLDVLDHATDEERLGLIRAHPELADKIAIQKGLTSDSAEEQASAGLDRLSPEEFSTFDDLNSAYRAAHGIPFIICVKLHDKASILTAMRSRLENPFAIEVDEAMHQIGLIALLRLSDVGRGQQP